jgi:hypothetical protein
VAAALDQERVPVGCLVQFGRGTPASPSPAGPEETAAEIARLLDEHIHGAHTDATSVVFEPELVCASRFDASSGLYPIRQGM